MAGLLFNQIKGILVLFENIITNSMTSRDKILAGLSLCFFGVVLWGISVEIHHRENGPQSLHTNSSSLPKIEDVFIALGACFFGVGALLALCFCIREAQNLPPEVAHRGATWQRWRHEYERSQRDNENMPVYPLLEYPGIAALASRYMEIPQPTAV